ncbi:MAG: BMP family ABC transporter substrate-binding protein, partial [Treponema sp.]|nr:BMP family ABC transporter substrate-binding protein [Treponema sp.]
GSRTAPNVSTYFGKIYQALYLSGVAAGYKTESKKIGYVAAFPLPEVIRGINAFTLGVLSVEPAATVEVIWTNTWDNHMAETRAANELFDKGCDVIAQHQDNPWPQIAAQDNGKFAIGYNRRTYSVAPNAYLTAPMFHWEVFYHDDVDRIIDGTWEPRAYWGGLKEGIVDLDNISNFDLQVTEIEEDVFSSELIEIEKIIAEVRASIERGTFEPFTGPLKDQNGVIRVPNKIRMSDDEIWNINWFVEGVIGSIPH